jgi:hypothetical protein
MAQLKLGKEIVVFTPLLLPCVGMCAPPQENKSFDSGVAHSFSGKNNDVHILGNELAGEKAEAFSPASSLADI